MFDKNSYASYNNNVVGPTVVVGPPVNYVAEPILLVPEKLESEIKQKKPKFDDKWFESILSL
jgi:hypothetical protein